MNAQTRQFLLTRLGGVCAGVVLGWVLLVKPALRTMSELDATVDAQASMISGAAAARASEPPGAIEGVRARLESAEAVVLENLHHTETGALLNRIVNDAAGAHGVTLASMESIATRPIQRAIGEESRTISGERHASRLVAHGSYRAILRFLAAARDAHPSLRFRTLRLSGTDAGGVRLNAELTLTTLSTLPGHASAKEGVAP